MTMISFYEQSPLLPIASLRENYRIFVRRHYLFLEANSFLRSERSSKETVSFEEQIMFKNKYPSAFLSQMGDTVLITLQILFATRTLENIIRISPSFSWRILCHMTQLDQSRELVVFVV